MEKKVKRKQKVKNSIIFDYPLNGVIVIQRNMEQHNLVSPNPVVYHLLGFFYTYGFLI